MNLGLSENGMLSAAIINFHRKEVALSASSTLSPLLKLNHSANQSGVYALSARKLGLAREEMALSARVSSSLSSSASSLISSSSTKLETGSSVGLGASYFLCSSIFFSASLSSTWIAFLLLVIIALHSSMGFFSVLAIKLLDDLSANCFASCPTWTSRFFMANSMLFWEIWFAGKHTGSSSSEFPTLRLAPPLPLARLSGFGLSAIRALSLAEDIFCA
ncbi:hypothetical protein GmHk_12G035191 [Glycine max]|nr:hypothetical protein GmHk_12G035191 [Glycine max]